MNEKQIKSRIADLLGNVPNPDANGNQVKITYCNKHNQIVTVYDDNTDNIANYPDYDFTLFVQYL